MNIEIEENVPIPPRTRKVEDKWAKVRELEAGQSALITGVKVNTVRGAVRNIKNATGNTYHIHDYGHCIRVWRITPKESGNDNQTELLI